MCFDWFFGDGFCKTTEMSQYIFILLELKVVLFPKWKGSSNKTIFWINDKEEAIQIYISYNKKKLWIINNN